MEEIYVSGTIKKILFQKEDSYFKIIAMKINDTNIEDYEDDEIIIKGDFGNVVEREDYIVYGSCETHSQYGFQVKTSRYEENPFTKKGLIKYLSGSRFKGIGPKKAAIIANLYEGDNPNIVNAILSNPDKLQTVKGLNSSVLDDFLDKLRKKYEEEQILSQLFALGIPPSIALKIEEKYSKEAVQVVKDNPYDLTYEIDGYGFIEADRIAYRLGIKSDSSTRIRAAIVYVLTSYTNSTGDTYMNISKLIDESERLLKKTRQSLNMLNIIREEVNSLGEDLEIIIEENKAFPKSLYYAEINIAENIERLLNYSIEDEIDENKIAEFIKEFEDKEHQKYDVVQKEAIAKAVQNSVFILTGGPGTGKTTVIKGIIYVYKKLMEFRKKPNLDILLAAPTGRAAKRMSESTGLPSKTIHSHLGLPMNYIYDDLEANLIIVDEFSMVDTYLADKLFKKVSTKTQIILVGDSGQLPSVAPGNVLHDLLEVDTIPSVKLEKVFRQSDDSTIVHLASDIRKGIMSADFVTKKPDRSYIEVVPDDIEDAVVKVVSKFIDRGIDFSNIQILAPMYKGKGGINELNDRIQEIVNPKRSDYLEFKSFNHFYRVGDRVIQLKNDNDQQIYNGDIGYVRDLIKADASDSGHDEIVILFESGEVIYEKSDWNKFTLAYAMSIHKSQGSEFPVVIMPITKANYIMLQRNLIYTGITRAKSKLVLIGEYPAFERAIKQVGVDRKTCLKIRFS